MPATDPTNAQLKAIFWSIKFYTDAATEIFTGQGIDSIKKIKILTQDRVTRLCSNIHKPGGGRNRNVVSKSAENIFHLLVCYFQHQDHVTRDTYHSLVTLVNLRAIFVGSMSLRRIEI